MKLPAVILEANKPYENRLVGAKIAEIGSIIAGRVAVLIMEHAPKLRSLIRADATDRDAIVYFCACMHQESRFDVSCYNLNLKAPRDAGLIARSVFQIGPWPPALDQGDYGCAQWSMRVVKKRPEFAGMTPEQIMARLFDPAWAIPAMVGRYVTLLQAARTKHPKVDPRDGAAGIYNKGDMGFACGYAYHFNEPYPKDATSAHIAKAPDYWKVAERHFNHIKNHRLWFQQQLD